MKTLNRSVFVLFTAIFLLSLTLQGCASTSQKTASASGSAKAAQPDTKSSSSSSEPKSETKGSVKSEYPVRNIEFIVGYKPGGGYSDWALALAPALEKHLPKKASVVVRHMPGAGSVTAAAFVQKAKPDGYTIGIYDFAGLAGNQLSREVQYDLSKVTWLGQVANDNHVVWVSSKGPYKSIEDIKKAGKTLILSTRGLGGNDTINAAVTLKKLGVQWKPLNHDGTSEAVLSIVRGDADMMWGSLEALSQFMKSGDLLPILFYDSQRNPDMPKVPIPSDIGLAELNETFNPHRLIGAPPGLPDDIHAILEKALKDAINDSDFKETLKKMKKTSAYLSGKDTEKVVKESLKVYEDYKNIVKELLNQTK